MEKILVIKLGALGDVIRTTPLLRVLSGDITWVTKKNAFELLPSNIKKADIKDEMSIKEISKIKFDLVLSLEEDKDALNLASKLKSRSKKFIGVYPSKNSIKYTPTSAPWFDLSLSSRFGKAKADELKKKNTLSYQEHLFNMIGISFKGEEYLTDFVPKKVSRKIIGIESRSGDVWPAKQWKGYADLAEKLRKKGYTVRFFDQKPTLNEYAYDINKCGLVITGDTLAMHLALVFKKPTVAIFTCTSAQEIYDYGRLIKVVSPVLNDYFYTREAKGVNFKISVQGVMRAVERFTKK